MGDETEAAFHSLAATLGRTKQPLEERNKIKQNILNIFGRSEQRAKPKYILIARRTDLLTYRPLMNIKTELPASLTPQQAPTRLEGSRQESGPLSHTLPSQLGKLNLPELSSLAKIQQQRQSAKVKDSSSSIGSKNSSSSSLPSTSSSSPQKSLSLLVEARDREKIRRAIAQKNPEEYGVAVRELRRELSALVQARERILNEMDGKRSKEYDITNDYSPECFCGYGEHFLEDY